MHTAIVCGVFQYLHEGHKSYIRTAFEFADKVVICLADGYVKRDYEIYDYSYRKNQIVKYIHAELPTSLFKKYKIFKLSEYDQLIDYIINNKVTVILATSEYYQDDLKINEQLKQKGYEPLIILVKERMKINGKEITSTEIMKNRKGIKS